MRPGDELTPRTTVAEARPSRSAPDLGLVRTGITLLRRNGAVVLAMTAMTLIRVRSAG